MRFSFSQRLENLPPEIWTKLIRIEELKGEWISGARLNPQILGRLKRSVLITSTGASTRIEGARMSDEDVEKLMKGLSVRKFADRDNQEVRGYFELLENVFEVQDSLRFSENTIKHLHRELLKYVEKDSRHRGEYKKSENKVYMVDAAGKSAGVIFDTTPAYLTSKEMQELVESAQEELKSKRFPALLVIGNFLVEFLLIHPFQDGNGRLSRILTNLLLLKNGYKFVTYVSHEKLVEDNKADYYMALRKSQKTMKTARPSITEWLDFFLTVIENQAVVAVDLLSKENVEKIFSPKQLAVWKYLGSVKEASPGEIAGNAGIARPTVNQALYKLMRLKKVERIGLGSSTRYKKL